MLTYWLMFALPAWAAVAAPTRPRAAGRRLDFSWLVVGVLLILLIGLRHQVGGDWTNYRGLYLDMMGASLQETLQKSDPGYALLVWLSGTLDGDVYLVNLMCAILFSWGLVVFCRHQPRPWLALAVAMPYLVIVLGMGYTRQGVALGLELLGLVALARQSTVKFVLFVALAALFHKTAVLLVPLGVLATPRNRIWTAVWVGISSAMLYWVLLADSVDGLLLNYVQAGYQSEGAAVRIAMNAVPAALLLLLRERLVLEPAERNLWTLMSLAALATVGVLLVSPSSTAVDRVALYLLPLQIFLFARLPDLLSKGGNRRVWIVVVVVYYALVHFVWLNYADNSAYWLPYQFYPLVGL
jgi:hypothetical protein